MKALKTVMSCNHQIEKTIKSTQRIKVTRTSKSLDSITSSSFVQRVFNIYTMNEEAGFPNKPFMLNRDYTIIGSSVSWIREVLNEGDEYYVECYLRSPEVKEYKEFECPRCMGNGWYVDLFGESELKFEDVQGTDKIVQEFLKGLFTERRIDGYGTDIKTFIGVNIYDPVATIAKLTLIINNVGENYMLRQSEMMSTGAMVSDDEILSELSITNADYVREEGTLYFSVTLVSKSGKERNISMKAGY